MPRLKYFNDSTQQWEYVVVGGQGPQGETGPGVASGGLEGQILAKIDGTDFNTEWIDNYAPDTRIIVKNDSGVTLPIGTPVMAVGAVGDRIRVAKAVADGSVEPRFMLGITFEEILDGEEGFLTLTGDIKGVNTNAYTLGDVLYIDPATPGALTTTTPSSPNLSMAVAIVTKVNSSSGHIFVRMWDQQSGLHELHDVLLDSTIAENELLAKNGVGLWVNKTASEAGLSEVGHTHDDRYYTESETDTLLSNKANASHTHAASDINSGTLDVNRLPSGTIIQQVHYTYNTYVTGTSGAWTDIHSGTRPAITAKRSDSHFIILASMNWLQEGSRRQMIRLLRNGSVVQPSDIMIATSIGSGWTQAQMFYQWKDTSARTAGTTYTFSFDTAVTAGTWYYNYNYGGITGTSMYSILEIVA